MFISGRKIGNVSKKLYTAFDKQGLVKCASSHRVEHWFFMGHGKDFDSDIKEPLKRGDFYWPAMEEKEHYDSFSTPTPTKEFLDDWLCRCCELVDKYRPKVVYFDWWIHHNSVKPYLRKFAAYYYNRAEEWGEGVVINYKHDAFAFGTAVCDIEPMSVAKHKCAICGRTSEEYPDLEFRFCSKCNGNYEYCQDYLFTHTHVQ